MPVKAVVSYSKDGDRVDAQRVSRLNEVGMVGLLSLLGNSLPSLAVTPQPSAPLRERDTKPSSNIHRKAK